MCVSDNDIDEHRRRLDGLDLETAVLLSEVSCFMFHSETIVPYSNTPATLHIPAMDPIFGENSRAWHLRSGIRPGLFGESRGPAICGGDTWRIRRERSYWNKPQKDGRALVWLDSLLMI